MLLFVLKMPLIRSKTLSIVHFLIMIYYTCNKQETWQISCKNYSTFIKYVHITVTDPGFPVWGRQPRRGAPTPEVAMFRKICMSK